MILRTTIYNILVLWAWLAPLIGPLAAQSLVETARIPLPFPVDGLTKVAATPWGDRFYLLDQQNLEVLAVDRSGTVTGRFGGWGSGPQSLDLPLDILFAENSLFILDEGQRKILRLDAGLNPVAATPLTIDRRPLAFTRDSQQRFWVLFENMAGALVISDDGSRLDLVGDEAGGTSMVLDPAHIARGRHRLAIWDRSAAEVVIFKSSGALMERWPFPSSSELRDLVLLDGTIVLLTEGGLQLLDPLTRQYRHLANAGCPQAIDATPGGLVTLDCEGFIRVLQLAP